MERSGSIQLDIPDFSNSVLTHLNQLRVQGRLCDIVVNVQGQSFRAHKVVLAASSPYFRDHMSLSQMSTVSLTVIRNPTVFEQLLTFCYTGRLVLQLADIISYLTAASFLQMQHIIDRCTQILEGIHLKISLADLDEEPLEDQRGSRGNRTLEAVVRGGAHHGGLRLLGPHRAAEAISPPEEQISPTLTAEHGGAEGSVPAVNRATKEPILRINRAGQWYVETSGEPERSGSAEEGGAVDQVRIKTERVEDWIGAGEQQPEAVAAEEGATVMIDTSGRSTLVPAPLGAEGGQSTQPSSSFSESDRFSPTGSVVMVTERQRAKSESPNQVDDLRQPSSQVPAPESRGAGPACSGHTGPQPPAHRSYVVVVCSGGGARRLRHGRLRGLPEGAGGRPLVPLQPATHLHLLLQVLQPEGQPGPPHAPAHGHHAVRLPHLWEEVHPQGPAGIPHPQTHGQQAVPLPRLWQELPLPGHPQPALPQEPPRLHPPGGPQRLPRDHHRLPHVPGGPGRRGLARPGGARGRGRDRRRRGPVRGGAPGLRVDHGARLRGVRPGCFRIDSSALKHVYLHSQRDQTAEEPPHTPTTSNATRPWSPPLTFCYRLLYICRFYRFLRIPQCQWKSVSSRLPRDNLEPRRSREAPARERRWTRTTVEVPFQCDPRVSPGVRRHVSVLNNSTSTGTFSHCKLTSSRLSDNIQENKLIRNTTGSTGHRTHNS
eukprot:XP_011616991.1 PREDICTED: zinc finger and BTB domain-containing protein 37 isoform X1 [Takifugu rubripes]